LLLAEALELPALRDVALVLALLAVIAVIAFTASVKTATPDQDSRDDR
ncbi:MAG: pH regulation protein F, partial [Thiohalocapsa sp.]|jgi:multisubunit Na+/H+ antiporter MnhF subunit